MGKTEKILKLEKKLEFEKKLEAEKKKNFLTRMFNWIADGNKKAAAKGQLCNS